MSSEISNGDNLRKLYEAAKAEQKAKDDFNANLNEIRHRLAALELAHREQAKWRERISGVIYSIQNYVLSMMQLLAGAMGADKKLLAEIQTKIADIAFEHQDSGAGIEIRASGDAVLGGDVVGGSKSGDKD